jgi:hypothetical protein
MTNEYRSLIRKPQERSLADLGIDGRTILKGILKEENVRAWN